MLPREYFFSASVVELARDLIGSVLHSRIDDVHTSGIIVESEAYSGAVDRASHAYQNKQTARTSVMFEEGGRSYVYLCYGLHHLFNIVTGPEGVADAILIRALQPMSGKKIMKNRRGGGKNNRLTSGPANLSKAMGINITHNNLLLDGTSIWISKGKMINNQHIIACPRVGVDYAGSDASLPWRFYVKDNPWVSKIN